MVRVFAREARLSNRRYAVSIQPPEDTETAIPPMARRRFWRRKRFLYVKRPTSMKQWATYSSPFPPIPLQTHSLPTSSHPRPHSHAHSDSHSRPLTDPRSPTPTPTQFHCLLRSYWIDCGTQWGMSGPVDHAQIVSSATQVISHIGNIHNFWILKWISQSASKMQ